MERSSCFGKLVVNLCASATLCLGAPARVPHASVEIVSEHNTLRPGHTSNIGVKFDLEPGWHIYWINAGDSGQPPVVKWQAPATVSVGEFIWPVPKRLKTGPLVDYGYEGSVLLMAPVAVNRNASGSVHIGAQIRLVVCQDICVPGKAALGIDLMASTGPSHPTANAELFSVARKQIPRALPPNCTPLVTDNGENFRLHIGCTTLPPGLTFFPLHANEIENAAPQPESRSNSGIALTLRKSDQLIRQPARLEGLLAGSGTGWKVSAPISNNVSNERSSSP